MKVKSKYVAIAGESFEIFLPEVFNYARAFLQASRGYGGHLLFSGKKIRKSAGVGHFLSSRYKLMAARAQQNQQTQDKLTRIAIVSTDKCKPKRCRQECKKSCPVVRMGKT